MRRTPSKCKTQRIETFEDFFGTDQMHNRISPNAAMRIIKKECGLERAPGWLGVRGGIAMDGIPWLGFMQEAETQCRKLFVATVSERITPPYFPIKSTFSSLMTAWSSTSQRTYRSAMPWHCGKHYTDNGHRSCSARWRQRGPSCNPSSARSRCYRWSPGQWQRHDRSTGWPLWALIHNINCFDTGEGRVS